MPLAATPSWYSAGSQSESARSSPKRGRNASHASPGDASVSIADPTAVMNPRTTGVSSTYSSRLIGRVYDGAVRARSCLKGEVKAKSLVEVGHDWGWHCTDPRAESFDRHGPYLLSLRLRVLLEAGISGSEQDLEGIDACDRRGHWHHRDHSPPEACRGRVGAVVADDHRRPSLVRLRSSNRVQVDEPDLTAAHRLPDHRPQSRPTPPQLRSRPTRRRRLRTPHRAPPPAAAAPPCATRQNESRTPRRLRTHRETRRPPREDSHSASYLHATNGRIEGVMATNVRFAVTLTFSCGSRKRRCFGAPNLGSRRRLRMYGRRHGRRRRPAAGRA